MRTVLYLAVLTGLFLAIGYYLGGQNGMFFALIIAAALNFGSYWFSSKIVLAMYGAKEMPREQYEALYRMITDLANRASLPMPKLYLIDMPTPNAFATGRDEHHAVVGVTRGIMEILTEDELRGVLAHELSHIKNKDMLVSTMAATLAGAISYLTQMIAFGGGRDGEGRGNLITSLALLILTPLLAMLIQLAVSRAREYGADKSGAELLGHGMSLAAALRKLEAVAKARPLEGSEAQVATSHLFIVNPFKTGGLANLFSTHPPMQERIRRLEQM